MTDEQEKDLIKLMEQFCQRAETYGCDSVQVLVSVTDNKAGTTVAKRRGFGNWYARQGMAKEFIDEERTRTEEEVKLREYDARSNDDGDDWKGTDNG